MKFLYPQVLWALTALLIPIIIHLFNFKRYKTLYFSSLKFIQRVDQEAKSTKQLKRLLVLAARILAFTCIVFAFAQPYWNKGNKRKQPGQPVFLHIDNSYSMQAQGYQGELLSMAKEKARDIIQSLPNDQLFIISTNALSGREERLLKKADAFEKIDQIQYSAINKNYQQVIDWQSRTVTKHDPESKWSNLSAYVFSDFQKINHNKRVNADLLFNYYPIIVKAENTDNLLIDSIWFEEPINRVGKSNRLNVRVANNSKEDLSNVELEFIGDAENKIVFVDIPSNSKTTSAITITNKKAGRKSGSVKIADQNIFFDDVMYYNYSTERSVNVLLLNGEDASANVGLIYSLDNYYVLNEKDFLAFTRDDLNNKDLIVLNGINSLPSGTANLLNEALESGTSIGLFPGKSPQNSELNKFLAKNNAPLMGSAISGGNRIQKINYKDPFFKGVFDKESEKLNLPGVSKAFASPTGGNSAHVILQLANGLPLLVYKPLQGNLFVYYSSLDESFGSFVNDALCSTIFLRMGELSKRQQPLYIELGTNASYPVYEKISSEIPVSIRNNELNLIPSQTILNGVTYLQMNNLNGIEELPAGNYDLVSQEKVGIASLNYSRKESQLDVLNEDGIRNVFGGENKEVKLQELSSNQQFDPDLVEKGSSVWKLFILLAITFVISEMLLIRFLK